MIERRERYREGGRDKREKEIETKEEDRIFIPERESKILGKSPKRGNKA